MIPLEQTVRFADVPLRVEVRLDQRILTIREILGLGTGSVIKMTRSAGENLDIYFGDVLAAFGEIVITETTTGVRITDFRQDH
jgi:flagellar motor switch protein FliN